MYGETARAGYGSEDYLGPPTAQALQTKSLCRSRNNAENSMFVVSVPEIKVRFGLCCLPLRRIPSISTLLNQHVVSWEALALSPSLFFRNLPISPEQNHDLSSQQAFRHYKLEYRLQLAPGFSRWAFPGRNGHPKGKKVNPALCDSCVVAVCVFSRPKPYH